MAELPVGIGGRAREQKIDSMVDEMVNGKGSKASAPSDDSGDPRHPAARHIPYTPSEQEKKTRNYGAPIQSPIVSK